eukprot:scaffold4004_cov105-Cylindrotheca_fusiformis.AAC.2
MASTTTTTTKANSPSSKYESEIQTTIEKRAAVVLMAQCLMIIALFGVIHTFFNIGGSNNNSNKTIMNEFTFEVKSPATVPDPLDYTVLFPNDVVFVVVEDTENTSMDVIRGTNEDDEDESEQENQELSLNGPIPPFHPHHTAFVTYSSHMSSGGSVEYRRDIRFPYNYGMLVFTVGGAKDDLPYRYEVYNDAYLFSDNNSLCILNPWYTGYQVSEKPFWNPTDPTSIEVKHLDEDKMHWISSRVINQYGSKKKYDRQKTVDYTVVAEHDFYDAHYYRALKAAVNQWK